MSVDERAVPRVPSAQAYSIASQTWILSALWGSDMPAAAPIDAMTGGQTLWTLMYTVLVSSGHGKIVPVALFPRTA